MLGLSLEKLIVIVLVAAVVVGPQRLPTYAVRLGSLVRALRDAVDTAKARAEHDLGVPLEVDRWQRDVRRYDPRAIVRDAFAEPEPSSATAAASEQEDRSDAGEPASSGASADVAGSQEHATGAGGAEQDARWVRVGGSSGHPRRRRAVEEPPSADDPSVSRA